MTSFSGSAREIGLEHGRACGDHIRRNLDVLVYRKGYEPLPREDRSFADWVRDQESVVARNWPWLLDEIAGVASAVGVGYEDILLLNLRAWQYEFYGAQPALSQCSSLAITLDDGTIACAGALDDSLEYYCGPVRFSPTGGNSFITFPMAGTSWANRGMNSRGLSIGTSSQVLPGLRQLPGTVNQDLALRVILEKCATVEEVREFCKAYPFTVNLVCADALGEVFCAQQTAGGMDEISPEGFCALTNHVVNEEFRHRLAMQGVTEFPEVGNTCERLRKLLDFASDRCGKCSAEEVMQFIGHRDDEDPATIHNKGTIYLTYANPRADSRTFWILQPKDPAAGAAFEPFGN